MSIAKIVTRGFGNGTLAGTIKDVVLRGYSIAVAAVAVIPFVPTATVEAVRAFNKTVEGRLNSRIVEGRR